MLVKIDTYFDGKFWCARGTSEDVFTQGRTYEELLDNIKEAVSLHFEEEVTKGKTIEILVMSELEVSGVA
jgi:predicted RNase H-like HicB family nuclease